MVATTATTNNDSQCKLTFLKLPYSQSQENEELVMSQRRRCMFAVLLQEALESKVPAISAQGRSLPQYCTMGMNNTIHRSLFQSAHQPHSPSLFHADA